jgi:hypothetical protein
MSEPWQRCPKCGLAYPPPLPAEGCPECLETEASRWYWGCRNEKLGPFSLEQLRALAAAGRLLGTDMLLREGEEEWVSAASVRGLLPEATAGGRDRKGARRGKRRRRLVLGLSALLFFGGMLSLWYLSIGRLFTSRQADPKEEGPGARNGAHPAGSPTPDPAVRAGRSGSLMPTAVVPTLDTAFAEGQSAVWCSSFQLAWNRLKKDVIGGPVLIRNAEALCKRLNRAKSTEEDLDPDSVIAAAGFGWDNIDEKVGRPMARKFPGVELPDFPEEGVFAFAYLQAEVKYRHHYVTNPRPLRFWVSSRRAVHVQSFGILDEGRPKRFDKVREQVEVLFSTPDRHGRENAEFAIDLCKHSRPNQIVLARVPRKSTLSATLADVQEKIRRSAADPDDRTLGALDGLLVPRINWCLLHHFEELEGRDKVLLNPRFDGLQVSAAVQMIEFRLDSRGAFVKSYAKIAAKGDPRAFDFDGPFLIFVKKRSASRPFFVMWVGNAELLCPFGADK